MTRAKLTGPAGAAKTSAKSGTGGRAVAGGWRRQLGAALVPAIMLGGCINVNAPDKPIVIELNINIRQEVIYRLAEDAADTIEENADIF